MKVWHKFLLCLIIFCALFVFLCLRDYSSLLQFRTSHSDFKWWTFISEDRQGLETLNVSGSAVLHENAMLNSFQEIPAAPSDIYVVNLTEGDQYYADGRPFRWFNWRKTEQGIGEPYWPLESLNRLKDNIKWFLRRLWYPRPSEVRVETEQQMVERLGYHYACFSVDRRRVYPPETIDRFLKFVKELPPKAWVHFHCEGGNSRTTTMMILYDIIRNGRTVSLETIIRRQRGLGGVDVNDTEFRQKGSWKHQNLIMRKTMIEDFYRYRTDPKGFGTTSWSQWFKAHGTAQDPSAPAEE